MALVAAMIVGTDRRRPVTERHRTPSCGTRGIDSSADGDDAGAGGGDAAHLAPGSAAHATPMARTPKSATAVAGRRCDRCNRPGDDAVGRFWQFDAYPWRGCS